MIATIFSVCRLVFSSLGYAGTVEGVLEGINKETQSLKIETSKGEVMIHYSETTLWNMESGSLDEAIGPTVVLALDEKDHLLNIVQL